MKKLIWISLSLALWTAIAIETSAQELHRDILGIRLNMTEKEAHERLKAIGSFVRNEEKRQEVWQVRDESFSHLLIGFGKDEKVRYVTAVAREDKDARRVAYEEIGNLKKARQAGDPRINNFRYEWELPAEKDNPHTLVIALGRDPKFLTTYSLKRLSDNSAAEEND